MDLGLLTEGSLKNLSLPVAPLDNPPVRKRKKSISKRANARSASVNNDRKFNGGKGVKMASKKQNKIRKKEIRAANPCRKGAGIKTIIATRKPGNDSRPVSNTRRLQVPKRFSQDSESSIKSISSNTSNSAGSSHHPPYFQVQKELSAIPGPSWFYPPQQASRTEQIASDTCYRQSRRVFTVQRTKRVQKVDSSTTTADEGSEDDCAAPGSFSFYPPRETYPLKGNMARRSGKTIAEKNIARSKGALDSLDESSDGDRDSGLSSLNASTNLRRFVQETCLKSFRTKTKLPGRNDLSNAIGKRIDSFPRKKYSLTKSTRSSQKQVENRRQASESLKSITMTKSDRYRARPRSSSNRKDPIGSYRQSTDRDSYKSELARESTDLSKIEESDDGYVTPGSSSLSSSYGILHPGQRSLQGRLDRVEFENDKGRMKLEEKREFANTRKIGDINDHSVRLDNFIEYLSSGGFSNSELELIENNLSINSENPQSPVIRNEEENQRKVESVQELLDSVNYTLNSRGSLNNDDPSWFEDCTRNYRELPYEYSDDDEDNEKSRNESEEYNNSKSFANESTWARAVTSTPVTNSCDRTLNSPSMISSLSSESNEGNNNGNHRMTFNFTSMKLELENAMCSEEPADKAAILKSYRLNRRADFDEMHRLPLAWRIPNGAEHSSDNKENHFRKTNGGNECKRLTRSSVVVLSERNSPSTSRRRPGTPGTPETPDSGNVDHSESDEKQEAERARRRKVILLNKLIAARNRALLERRVMKNRRQTCGKLNVGWGKKRGQRVVSGGLRRDIKGVEKSDESSQSSGARKRRRAIGTSDDECVLKRESRFDGGGGMNIPGESQDCQDVRRITRGLTKTNKENFIGKLVWGSCSGWWPALIVDADHVGMLSEPGKLWVYWIGEARISLLNERTQIEPFLQNLEVRLKITPPYPVRTRAIDATMQLLRPRFGCNLTKPYYSWITSNIARLNLSLDDMRFYPYPYGIERILEDLKTKNAKATEKYLKEMENEKGKEKNKSSDAKKSNDKPKDPMYQSNPDEAQLPLRQQKPGTIAWAKIAGHFWWPAMIIDYRDCCMREPGIGCQWIMWYGDHQLSQIHHRSYLEFGKGFHKMIPYIRKTKNSDYLTGVLQAAKDYCSRLSCSTEDWSLSTVIEYFEKNPFTDVDIKTETSESSKVSDVYTPHILKKLTDLKNNLNLDDERQDDLEHSDELLAVKGGTAPLEKLCLKCLKMFDDEMEDHPFFQACLCKECSAQFKPCMFLFGTDGKCFHCTICGGAGTVLVCGNENCPRVYCRACMKHLFCPNTYEDVIEADPWECFLCKPDCPTFANFTIKPRLGWKDKLIDMFRTRSNSNDQPIENFESKRKLRVLSLFDGLSTGLLVLLKLGFEIEVFYASEIDKDALMVSNTHFGDRIIHLGDVRGISKEKINEIAPIDFLMGGSPCNDLSLANPARRGLYDPEGTGILFFDYCRIKKLLMKANKGRHLFWLFENVASMPTEYRLEMNKHLGQEPDVIDSADFSPQHRLRLYWHNLPLKLRSLSTHGEQDVQDILTPNCQRYALVKKIRTVTTKVNSLKQGKFALMPILMEDEGDSLWITELEEIFGFPRHFTDVKNLCATKRQKLIGRAWSVQTLMAIFRSLCPYFVCNTTPTI